MTRRALPVALALVLVVAGPARAFEATRDEVRLLAETARTDPKALVRLEQVTSIDGDPVNMKAVLEGASGEVLDARLHTIAASAAGGEAESAEDARRTAREILDDRRFKPPAIPRPLRGPLERGGEILDRLFSAAASRLPGGEATLWAILGALVLALATLLTLRTVRTRSTAARSRREQEASHKAERPVDLERAAEHAEREGDFARAIRLRFRAGLLRLARAGAVEYRASLTNRELVRRVGSRRFRSLAEDFDAIAYGPKRPTAADAAVHRSGWEEVLHEGAR